MAALTARGGPAGVGAMRNLFMFATASGASVGSVCAATPPLLTLVAADATEASTAKSIRDASASARVRYDSKPTLFRRPAGLADGLARKEPAPPVDHHGISPKQPGSPALRNDPEIRRYVSIGSLRNHLERFV